MIQYKGEINILRQLLKTDGVMKTTLVKKCGLGSGPLTRHLNSLREEGLIRIRKYGRMYLIELNKESPKYECVKKLWGEKSEV